MDSEQKKYEIGFLAKSDADREQLIKILENHGASIIDSGNFSRLRLAYPIKKENSAHFGYLHFSSTAEAIKKIGSDLKLNAGILRFLILTPPIIKSIKYSVEKPKKTIAPETERKEEIKLGEAKPISPLTNKDLEEKLEEILK